MQLTAEERKALKALGVHGTAKCDYCRKLIKTALHYNGSAGETYCTNACFELGEKTTRSRVERQYPQKEDTIMIDKKKSKATDAEVEEPKKKKKAPAPEPEPEEVPKKKKKAVAPADEDEEDAAPKKKKKAAPAPEPDEDDEDADAGDDAEDEDPKPAKKKKSKPAAEEDEEGAPPAKKNGKKSKADAEDEPTAKPAKAKKDKPGENPFREGTMCHKAFERLLTGKSRTLDALFKGYEVGDKRRMISNMAKRGIERGGFTIVRNADDTYQLGGGAKK